MHHIKTRAQLAEAIWRMEQAGAGWHVPLLRAVLGGTIRAVFVAPGSRVPRSLLDMSRHPRPLVVVLAGDGGGPAEPDAFPQARRLLRWARFIILHGTGGEASHYALAAEAAIQARRVLLVETTSAALPAWFAAKSEVAPATPGIGWAVPPGKPAHPINGAPAGTVLQ